MPQAATVLTQPSCRRRGRLRMASRQPVRAIAPEPGIPAKHVGPRVRVEG
jgi:hypothetical protein